MTIRYNIEKALSQRVSTLTREMMISVSGEDFKVFFRESLIAKKEGRKLTVFTENLHKAIKTRLNVILELYKLPQLFQLDFNWYFEDSIKTTDKREFEVFDAYYNIYTHDGQLIELLNATSLEEIREWLVFRYADTHLYQSIAEIEEQYNLIINITFLPI